MDVYPKTEDELYKIIRNAYEEGNKIQVLGDGKHVKKERADFHVYTKRMNRFEIKGDKVVAEAGAEVEKIRKEASDMGLLLPTLYDGTVGGLLATNSPSPLTTKYGRPSDFTESLKMLTPYGGIRWKIFAGSMGLLGAISEAELRLFPKPQRIMTYEKLNVIEDDVLKVIENKPIVLLVDYDGKSFNIHASFSEDVNLKGFSIDEGVPIVEVNNERDEVIVNGDNFSEFKKVVEVSKPAYAYWIYKSNVFMLYNANKEQLRTAGIKYYSRNEPKEVFIKLKRLLDGKNIFV
ncbi:MAG: FAD-binding oxidoreductase [Sulfolobus sp.]